MAAVKLRRRQVEQAVAVLINQPAALLGRRPVLAGDDQRRFNPRRLPLDDGERLARLRRHRRRHAALEDAGLLRGDRSDRVAEKIAVVERHRRDRARQRTLDDVGGVQPSAKSDFEQQHVGRMPREQQECRRGLISNNVIGWPPLALSHSASAAASSSSVDELAAAGAPMRKRSLKRTKFGEV